MGYGKTTKVINIASYDTKLDITQCDKTDFQYWIIAPYLTSDVALLGELNKIVTVSETRYSDLRLSTSDTTLTMKVKGAPDKLVLTSFYYIKSDTIKTVSCYIGTTGTNLLSIDDDPNKASCSPI